MAKSSLGSAKTVPGTALSVLALQQAQQDTRQTSCWLSVLEGELIIDLPHGDFRLLKVGDCLTLPAGVPFTLNPVELVVVLLNDL